VNECLGSNIYSPQKSAENNANVPKHLRRVLAVDDNKIILKMYTRWGKESGHTVVTVDDGDIAVELVKTDRNFDVILMDKEISRMGGVEASKRIRDLGYNGAIALVTRSVLSEDESISLNNVFDTIIVKGDERTYQDYFLELDQRDYNLELDTAYPIL
jgi:CheY-like chemotaxis protein